MIVLKDELQDGFARQIWTAESVCTRESEERDAGGNGALGISSRRELGEKFLRQHIIGDYIVDFVSRHDGLVIEVDGGYHSEPRQQEEDKLREEALEQMGYHVIRFTNEEVLCDIENVLNQIENYFKRE